VPAGTEPPVRLGPAPTRDPRTGSVTPQNENRRPAHGPSLQSPAPSDEHVDDLAAAPVRQVDRWNSVEVASAAPMTTGSWVAVTIVAP
jgi:hypothetical protein